MESSAFWLLVMSIATPVAGVVGFAIQLRQVRKAKLENEKLLLEIAALKSAAAAKEQVIQRATTDEVLRFGRDDVMFSRGRGPNPGPEDWPAARPQSRVTEALVTSAVIALVILVVAYVVYDLYRFALWVANAL
jgi:hypothetical protein